MRIGAVEYRTADGVLPEDLRDQLALLIVTPMGTVVLDRDFGLDTSFIDMPEDVARTMLASELAEKIERYIPALSLREVVTESAGQDGTLNLKVVVDIVGGAESAGPDPGN